MKYAVVKDVSNHAACQLNSSERKSIYGVYDDIRIARIGLKDAVSIFEQFHHTENTNRYHQAVNTIVSEPDVVVIVGVRVYNDDGETNAIMATFRVEQV